MRATPATTPLIRQARRVNRELAAMYPDAFTELHFDTPLQLAVATILSAQSTDKKINAVTPALFARYPDAAAYATADREELETYIHATGFFHAKANTLMKLGQALVADHDGQLPATLDSLVALPGFGRKTAAVVAGNAHGEAALAVDTHVIRVANRLGWSQASDAIAVESNIAGLIAESDWTVTSSRLTLHGRRRCHARRPACGACAVNRWCPSSDSGETDPVKAARLVKEDAAGR